MKYAYYPGCSAHSTARDMHISTLAVADALGIELIELAGWTCCGATAAHQTDRILAASLPAANLLMAQDMGMDMVANCAACFNRMKMANCEVSTNPLIRQKVSDAIGRDYDGSVKVRHFLEILLEDIGLDEIGKALKCSLNGLKVACYYGCLLVRPPEVMKFDDPENPTSLDRLVTVMGGKSLEWPSKLQCCGGAVSMSRTDVVIDLTDSILSMAKAAGAECITTNCPMCQVNLDLRQKDIEKKTHIRYEMPIVYLTQLLGLCLGVSPDKLGFDKAFVSPSSVIDSVRDVV
ncbi:CoB--CoM heterodisulfide reductase iron-sulfur subunit B family protein [Planctomycetota bacterium]